MKTHLPLLLVLISTVAFGQDKPKPVDFTRTLRGFDGKVLNLADEQKKPVPMTLSDVSITALETVLDEDRGLAGADKFKHDLLARRIYRNKHIVLKAEEVTLLKERIAKVYGPVVVGAAWPLLDPGEAQQQIDATEKDDPK